VIVHFAQKRLAQQFRDFLHYNSWRIAFRLSIPEVRLGRHKQRRIPKLGFTKLRGIGWNVSFRDPHTRTPRRVKFGMVDKDKARALYQDWLSDFVKGKVNGGAGGPKKPVVDVSKVTAQPGSLLAVASSYLFHEERRTRKAGEPRRLGTISAQALADKRYDVRHFLSFINKRFGPGAAGRLPVIDLKMDDIEAYNRALADAEYSETLVKNRMAAVKGIIDRAGRLEHGEQRLTWNWNARDTYRGKAGTPRKLPSLPQLKAVLAKCDTRTRAIVWTAIGLGFGQGDLTAVKAGQIDKKSYDLRRGKTGLERYGPTPPGVWTAIAEYLKQHPREPDELLFVSQSGQPLTHGNTDSVDLWWRRLRLALGSKGKGLSGFYVLRHLGATEFGSRPGGSPRGIRRWLGHAASSSMADVYMRPVAPEHRDVVEWVRARLLGNKPLV